MKTSTFVVAIALTSLLAIGTTSVRADPVLPGNILVSQHTNRSVLEYTPTGNLLQQFVVPYPTSPIESLRDIVVDGAGRIQIYNGTFDPYLTTLTPTVGPGAATYDHHTFAGWSTVNNGTHGGIGVVGNFAFVTDAKTFGPGDEPMGLIRFDLTTFAAQRFATANDYSDLTIGQNGLVYALAGGGPADHIDVFDPLTLSPIRSIPFSPGAFGADIRGIAVDASENIYAAGWDRSIYHLDRNGAVVRSLPTGLNLLDIDLGLNGSLVVAGGFTDGHVILTTTALNDFTSFPAGFDQIHVAFTSPAGVPEPSVLALTALGLAATVGGTWWKRRKSIQTTLTPTPHPVDPRPAETSAPLLCSGS